MSEEETLVLEHEGGAALAEMGEFVPDHDDTILQAEIDETPTQGHPVSIPIDGEWTEFPNAAAAEQAAYEEHKRQLKANAQNFRITDDTLGVGGAKAKFRANMAAINLLKELEFEGAQATPEQQEVLSRYVGWGGLADAFDESKENWKDEFVELYTALSPKEYAAARASTLSAHYTSPTVIKAIYEAVGNMSFQTGNILEPSMGVGNFFGLLPDTMSGSRLYGVELDSITGRIAKQLYPKANITVTEFETTDRRDFFDLAIGNVPFGQYQVNDRAYNKLGFSIHDYFFAKTLDQVRPGGVIAFVTSRYTMDKQSPDVRKYIAQRAELLGAIRLPNNAFKANAGTEVVSDIIFLQKRDRPVEIEPDWVRLGKNDDGFAINQYFIDNPEMVLGRQTSESTQYGRQDFTVEPYKDLDLGVQLKQHRPRKKRSASLSENIQRVIDLETVRARDKGIAYERWATNFNSKAASKSLLYLQTSYGGSYEKLAQAADEMSAHSRALSGQMTAAQKRLEEIDVLRRHILNYAHTREVFQQYKASGYSKKFLEEHRQEIETHRASKRAFNELGLKKLPSKKTLDAEYSQVLAAKNRFMPHTVRNRESSKSFWFIGRT